ncbi:mannitol dehydrogenase family protein [uncultured Jatrophihabitans sp.]|uniref:mannitol dehydrogenase family protein n=1 Tax=uncultured Jatrophihabitans sp. TaxID=1610747 RepID=UPI0035CA7CF1
MTASNTVPQLSAASLPELAPDIDAPCYDRTKVQVGIVHFGVGGFHRAHQATYLHRLMQRGQALDYGICGVGLLAGDARMRDVLHSQDGLYTVIEQAADGTRTARVVGSIVRYLFAPDDPAAVLDALTDPAVRIVSMTVTEGGYCRDPHGDFDPDHPDVRADLAGTDAPHTPFGLVVDALARRRAQGTAAFTVLSCDNVPNNGRIARDTVCGFAALRDNDLADWIRESVSFPASMVDRITPATADSDLDEVADRLGARDEWPVLCESFTQWVVEDEFPTGRPPLQDVGVQLVDDSEPYETLKLRLLNGGHQALGYLGALAGHRYVDDAAGDPQLSSFFTAYTDEVIPTLPAVEGIDVPAYRDELLERFGNPAVRDTLERICSYSSDRIPTFVLPALRDNLAAGRDVRAAALLLAAWARYCEGAADDGTPLELVDPRADQLRETADRRTKDPLAFLRDRSLFGDLVDDARFTDHYATALDLLVTRGATATCGDYT